MKNVNKYCRNASGPSSYFRGAYNRYGEYQWNVKLKNLNVECSEEILGIFTEVQLRLFEEYCKEELRIDPKYINIDGRSGGWLVVDTELTNKQIASIDKYVASTLKHFEKQLIEFINENNK